MDYKTAGVDIEKGRAIVEHLKLMAPSIGGFNGMMEIPSGYEKPVLVSGADGVGTKINIARIAHDYTTIGQDLVAMCVNDVICSGAKPLYFLDYISTKSIDANVAEIMVGIVKGCEIAGMELLGGETAEHYKQNDYDLAGFCTGIVEKNEIVDGSNIRAGDLVIGIESSGFHSNGYTLINDMLSKDFISLKYLPELLRPTTIYAPLIQYLMDEIPILGMAHITGGGIPENLPRCLPPGLRVDVNYGWDIPDMFGIIQNVGDISDEEMRNVFNLGIGFCLVVPYEVAEATKTLIADTPFGMKSWVIGSIV